MACPVCFTDADPIVTESLNAGILVLLSVTGVVLAGVGAFAARLIRRASAAAVEPLPGESPGLSRGPAYVPDLRR